MKNKEGYAQTKTAYKLCRQLKSGEITPLFINKTFRIPFDEWLEAEEHPTKGYKFRPHWHCMSSTSAPHLTEKNRVWVEIEMQDYKKMERPENQGGTWYLADKVKFIRKLSDEEVSSKR